MANLGKICMFVAAFSHLSAAESCEGVSCIAGSEQDVVSLVQMKQNVKHRSPLPEKEPDTEKKEADDSLADAVSQMVDAKMLFKRRLTERERAFHKFEAGKHWAEGRIVEGSAELAALGKQELVAKRTAAERRDAARHIWAMGVSQMLSTEKALAQGNSSDQKVGVKDINKMKADAEKYAADALKKQLEEQVLAKKHEDDNAVVAQITSADLLADKATFKQVDVVNKAIESEVDMQVLAEQDLLLDEARSQKMAEETLERHLSTKLSKLIEIDSHVQKDANSLGETKASVDESGNPKDHMAIVFEAVGDIADRTRTSLYGELSERAIRLASAKMIYKKSLFMQRFAAEELASARVHAQAKIAEGKESLKVVAENRRVAAEKAERKVNEARTNWMAMVAKAHAVSSGKNAGRLSSMASKAETKAEEALNVKLAAEQKADITEMIVKRSNREKAAAQQHHVSDEEVVKQANSQWRDIAKQVDAEVAKEEQLIAKEGAVDKDDQTGAETKNLKERKSAGKEDSNTESESDKAATEESDSGKEIGSLKGDTEDKDKDKAATEETAKDATASEDDSAADDSAADDGAADDSAADESAAHFSASDDSAPAKYDSAPAEDVGAPAADSAPDKNDSAPAADDSEPAVDDSAPETDDSAPETDDSAPAADDSELASNSMDDSAPAVDDSEPAAVDSE